MSEDIRYRQNRYLLMMGIRLVCFIAALLMFVNHLGWLAAVPAVGAIIIPYIAVVFANGGREPDNVAASWSTARIFRPGGSLHDLLKKATEVPGRRSSAGKRKCACI